MADVAAQGEQQDWNAAIAALDGRIDAALASGDGAPAPLLFVAKGELEAGLASLEDPDLAEAAAKFAAAIEFKAGAGERFILPGADGAPVLAVIGCGAGAPIDQVGAAPNLLPAIAAGWRFVDGPAAPTAEAGMREWLLGAYRYDRYKKSSNKPAKLAAEPSLRIRSEVAGSYLARDLVNTPTADLGPDALEQAARALAAAHKAECSVIAGEALLEERFPMIHAVGRAAVQKPRLIDIRWKGQRAPEDAPLIVLVGKGVCFDTGGLDLKPAAAMRNMKKDMGGSAAALGAASILMRRNAKVRLRVLIPAVENAIGPDAFRPGDVLNSRANLTVEIDNTDAEGRLVLADALTYGAEEDPDLMIDFATLTGAARIALGAELPPLYCDDDALAEELLEAGRDCGDPLWRMPLYQPYAAELTSSIADVVNSAKTGFGGSITAALFLQRFIGQASLWAHLDIFAWNLKSRPGRPEGGEAHGARAVAAVIAQRYGATKQRARYDRKRARSSPERD
ncbi:MAG: leucyl aminopeptidase family protein [Neomegalonema sp.]|nr:leucyl aminopeptidase family protein [Neomegalonema sp.]